MNNLIDLAKTFLDKIKKDENSKNIYDNFEETLQNTFINNNNFYTDSGNLNFTNDTIKEYYPNIDLEEIKKNFLILKC